MILRKHSYFRYICILIYSCLMPVLLHSQNVVKQISNADGLSNNSVNCFLEDSEHTLWVGTWDGLNAYNGRSFKTYSYNKKNAGSISNNVIWQIIEQNDSVLWVSTDYGVNRWKRSTQQFTPYYLGTQNNPPKQEKSFLLGITSGKYIICYVKEQGLFYFDDRKQDFVPLKNNLPDDIKNFVIDSKDQVFFLTGHLDMTALKGAKILSFASIFNNPLFDNKAMVSVFKKAKEEGMIICADMVSPRLNETLDDITEALSYVDYFFPNFEEASGMTGETDEAKVADKLYACGVKNVIMKIGKRGCYIRNAEGSMIVPACKGVTAIDTIGAGDNFASGFITALLEGKDIRECAVYANCTAAVSVQYVGATGGVTDKAIVDEMLAKYREDYK